MFDLDGTLADAYEAIQESLNYARTALGYPSVSYRTVKKTVGKGDRLFVGKFFSKDEVEKALNIYRRHHQRILARRVKARPYARSVLWRLKRKKRFVSIASNRPTRQTRIILEKLNFLKYIDFILCADKIKKIKPNPDILLNTLGHFHIARSESVFVGDMALDIETARRAGVDALFISGGSTSVGRLRQAYRGTRVIRSLEDILKIYE